MQWDLVPSGLALLAAMSAGCGALVALLVGGSVARRLRWWAAAAVACLVTGLLTSEVGFGWATEDDLQPNVGGLSVDEVLLAQVVTGIVVVLVARWPRA